MIYVKLDVIDDTLHITCYVLCYTYMIHDIFYMTYHVLQRLQGVRAARSEATGAPAPAARAWRARRRPARPDRPGTSSGAATPAATMATRWSGRRHTPWRWSRAFSARPVHAGRRAVAGSCPRSGVTSAGESNRDGQSMPSV